MHYLAQGLQKYYVKKRKRIVFCGNISLHELALTLWQELGFSEIDTSVVSRVLQGKRLFSPKQLHAFCKILAICGTEKIDLFTRLSKDLLIRSGMHTEHASIEYAHLTEFISHHLRMIEKIYTLHPQQGHKERQAFIATILSFQSPH